MTNEETSAFIDKYLRQATFPVAVKLLKGPLPEKVKTARQLYKHRLAVCQGITIARRLGRTIGFEKEDHECPISHVLLGFVEEPDMNKEGSFVHPLYTKDLAAGKNTAAREVHLDHGTFESLILAPLYRADFEPDVVIVYGNPAQITRLVQGALWKEGGSISSSFMGRGACGSSIGYPYKTKQVNVVIPGGGERVFGMTGDDEMCFAIPQEKLSSVLEGLKAVHDGGVARMPTPFLGIAAEPVMPPSYKKLSDFIGL
ncbi:MAG: DUF169 domain-containing protein [Deltaproteobacteria bacterium]|jgi:uncharacterized protein (DUF169 family)|nr:DUF169 domain-containing protein [Deltaproteobacteria bacterium]